MPVAHVDQPEARNRLYFIHSGRLAAGSAGEGAVGRFYRAPAKIRNDRGGGPENSATEEPGKIRGRFEPMDHSRI